MDATPAAYPETFTVAIGGMSCTHCVTAVHAALAGVDGARVERVDVGSATVRYDPARTSPAAIAEAVRDAGYDPADV
jgi:copper chaperone CopZ